MFAFMFFLFIYFCIVLTLIFFKFKAINNLSSDFEFDWPHYNFRLFDILFIVLTPFQIVRVKYLCFH